MIADLKVFYLLISIFCSYFEFLINFYNLILLIIFIFVCFCFIYIIINFNILKKEFSIFNIEIFLTISSFFIILFCFIPSLEILKSVENNKQKYCSINIFGYQWYWNYYFNNFLLNQKQGDFFNYVLEQKYNLFDRRKILNNNLLLPFNTNLLFISISDNVIHSWFIPELNIKLEVNPGFINYYFNIINKSGIFFGNCAEICGQGHSNIPILIEIVPFNYFYKN